MVKLTPLRWNRLKVASDLCQYRDLHWKFLNFLVVPGYGRFGTLLADDLSPCLLLHLLTLCPASVNYSKPVVTSSAFTFDATVASSVTTTGLIRLEKVALRIVQIMILLLDHPAQRIEVLRLMIDRGGLILLDLNYRRESSQVVGVVLITMKVATLLWITVMLGFLSPQS